MNDTPKAFLILLTWTMVVIGILFLAESSQQFNFAMAVGSVLVIGGLEFRRYMGR